MTYTEYPKARVHIPYRNVERVSFNGHVIESEEYTEKQSVDIIGQVKFETWNSYYVKIDIDGKQVVVKISDLKRVLGFFGES